MKTRWAIRFLFFVIGSYLAVAMVLRTEWAASRICHRGASVASQLLGQEVELIACSFDPWRTTIALDGVRLELGAGHFAAERLEVHFSPLSLGRSFGIALVELDAPEVVIDLSEPGEAEGPPPSHRGCLRTLERHPVDGANIRGGKVTLLLPGDQAVSLEEVDLDVGREGRVQLVELRVGDGTFTSPTREPLSLDDLHVRGGLDASDERLDLHTLDVAAVGASLSGRGLVRQICAPLLALETNLEVDLERFGAQLAPELGLEGTATLGASLFGPVGDLQADGILGLSSVVVGDLRPGDLSAGLELGGGRVEIRDLVLPISGGRAVVNGEVELSERLPTMVEVRTEALPFHMLMTRLAVANTPVMMAIDSVHRLEGTLLGGLLLQGSSTLALHDFRVRNEPWHVSRGVNAIEVPGTATLEGRVRLTADGIHLSSARAAFGKGTELELDARLYFSEARGMHIFARSPAFHFEDINHHVATVPIQGVGQIQAVIEGPYSDPTIEGDVDIEDAMVFGGKLGRLQSRALSLPGQGLLHFREVEGLVGATTYRGEVDLEIGADVTMGGAITVGRGGKLTDLFHALHDIAYPFEWLHGNLGGTVRSGRATFGGVLPALDIDAEVDAHTIAFMDRPFDDLRLSFAVEEMQRLHTDDLFLSRGEGQGFVAGVLRFPDGETASVDVTVDAEGLPIRDLLGEFGAWAELEGEVKADARLKGPIDALDLRGELHGTGLATFGTPLESTRLSLETQGDQVMVRGAALGAGNLSAAIRLVEDLPFDAVLSLDVPRLDRLLPSSMRIGGTVLGQAVVAGTLASISEAAGSVTFDELALTLAEYRVESRRSTSLSFSGPAFVLYGLDLEGENTSLSLYGNRSLDGLFDLQAQGTFDARLVGALLPELEHPSGVVSVKASMTGTGERPILFGAAEVRRGAFRFRDLPLQIQNLNTDVTFSQNQVVIQDATMLANGGEATLGGSVSLRSFSPDVLDLVVEGSGVSWRLPADWPAVVSGRIALTGRWTDAILLSGQARVDRLRWLKDLDIEKAILDVRRKVERVATADEREWVRFDIDLLGGQDMRIDSNHVRAHLQFVGGRLRLVGSQVHPALVGSVEVLEGTGLFRGNEYRVTNGMVDFRERDRIDPSFDITAETEVREYRIAAHAWGKLEDFQVDLQSDPVLAQADILTLLTFGITSRDLDTGQGAAFSGASLAAEALLTVAGFDEAMRQWIPRTPLLMDPDLSVTSQFSELTGQMEPMAVFEAKVLTDRLKLSAAAPFATTKGRRASAEVQVNDHLSTQLSWQNEAVGYSSGDLGFDLKLRWEWE